MTITILKTLLISLLPLFLVTEQPVFNNGGETLSQFLEANMVYPAYAKQNCIQTTIKVSFKLNKKSELLDVKVKDGLGIDLDDEAIRLMELTSNKWVLPKNYDENSEVIIPVTFALKNYNCDNQSAQSIEKAIALYRIRQDLENVVTSYYKNRREGTVNESNEQEINRLKVELGFDSELVAEKLAEANKMLKQGDRKAACKIWHLIQNIGFEDANDLIAQNCK